MGKYIMALDQGTTSSRTILFDKKGNIVCQANKEFEQIFPKPGWVEHNPEEIWMTQLLTMEDVMRQAGITGKDIEAIGITNQRETTVIWDKNTGKPIYNAIVWQCRRTSDIVDGLVKDGFRDFIRNRLDWFLMLIFQELRLSGFLIMCREQEIRQKMVNCFLEQLTHGLCGS